MPDFIFVPHRGARLGIAGRGERLAARILDNFLMLLPLIGGLFVMGMIGYSGVADDLPIDESNVFAIAAGLGFLLTFGAWVANMLLLVATGQTIGKRMMSLEMVSAIDGTRVGAGKAVFVREVLFFMLRLIPLGGLVLIADALWIFGNERRCLHDLAAATHVVSLGIVLPEGSDELADVFR